MIYNIKVPPVLKIMNNIFEKNGFKFYLVGGAVRGIIMKKKPADYDCATNASPQDVMKMFYKVIPTGIAHGTVTVLILGEKIEVTTFRTESIYSDGRHPDFINYASTIEEDLARRDFTMNAAALSLKDMKIIDIFGSRKDIKNKIIRTVGDPCERFKEDGLRPVRAIRFAAQLGFKIEEKTFKAVFNEEIQNIIKKVSPERFRDEFIKLLKSEKPSYGLKIMEETGIMKLFMPEFLPCRSCIQKDIRAYHEFDVMDHLFYACDGAPKEKINVRLAALFHDIGKPQAKQIQHTPQGDIYTFYNHESYSEQITKRILSFLRFPNSIIENVCHLVKNHMFNYEPSWTDAAVRRFIVRIKSENIDDLFDLRLADIYGMHNTCVKINGSSVIPLLLEFKDRIEKIKNQKNVFDLKSLAVNGKDLMAIGIPSGKKLGFILKKLMDTVLDDPEQNQKEVLLKIAKKIYEIN